MGACIQKKKTFGSMSISFKVIIKNRKKFAVKILKTYSNLLYGARLLIHMIFALKLEIFISFISQNTVIYEVLEF